MLCVSEFLTELICGISGQNQKGLNVVLHFWRGAFRQCEISIGLPASARGTVSPVLHTRTAAQSHCTASSLRLLPFLPAFCRAGVQSVHTWPDRQPAARAAVQPGATSAHHKDVAALAPTHPALFGTTGQ